MDDLLKLVSLVFLLTDSLGVPHDGDGVHLLAAVARL